MSDKKEKSTDGNTRKSVEQKSNVFCYSLLLVFIAAIIPFIYQSNTRSTTLLEADVEIPEFIANAPRIVAIGDLHGDFENTIATFKMAGLINNAHDWIAGDTVFVQTGDIVDRGPDTIILYKLMQKLILQASKQGGVVIPLLGNHEVMNLMDDWRYVTSEDIESFGGEGNRRIAWSDQGWLGKYIRKLGITCWVNGTVFFHGGAHPKYGKLKTKGLNELARIGTKLTPQEMWQHRLFGGDGPLWYRDYAQADEAEICSVLKRALKEMDAKMMVVGHTPQQSGRILSRCKSRVHVIDVGISRVYGGNSAAFEMINGKAYAIYPNGKVPLK